MNAEVRSLKTPAEQALTEAFAAAKSKLPGQGAVAALRADAFAQFDKQGLPHRRVEEWKYTDLRALWREAKPLASPPDAKAKDKAKSVAQELKGIDCRRLTFVDGTFVAELSDLTAESGVTIKSMADALAKGDALVGKHVGKVNATKDPALALNTALMGDGAVIHVAAGVTPKKPILLVFAGTQPASVFTRSLVVLEKGASLFLIEAHQATETQTNSALELLVADEATFDHLKITHTQSLHLSSLLAEVGAQAKFNSFAFTAGSTVVRNQSFIRFAGDDTEAAIGGVSLLKGREHVDNTLVVNHASLNCMSRERFRSVLDNEARAVFQGKIIVEPGAQKTDAKMLSNALLLSDNAEADNKPELEIFADDVQCGHGATAGALDDDLLFYLRARGIPEKEAEALLIQAFIGEVVETIAQESVREPLMAAAVKWLEARN
jgi:Fe-S cluster assembly protein SufD